MRLKVLRLIKKCLPSVSVYITIFLIILLVGFGLKVGWNFGSVEVLNLLPLFVYIYPSLFIIIFRNKISIFRRRSINGDDNK
jgi:hypothetical protein